MAERIVDLLEAVEVEQQYAERFAAAALPGGRVFDLLCQGGAIGEAGQRIVMRQKRDALVRFPALGYVVDDDDEIFRLAGLVTDDHAAGRLDAYAAALWRFDFLFPDENIVRRIERFDVVIVDAHRVVVLENVEYGPVEQFGARYVMHRFESPVDQDIFQRFGVFHDHRNRNVLDDRVEEPLGLVQFAGCALLFGDVIVGRDPAASRQQPPRDAD